MAEPYIGQLMTVGFNFAPRGWALCDGQILPISQNTALFSLLGNTYGGDGQTTFALPDLRGRSVVGFGNGPGFSNIGWGQKGGSQSMTLTTNQMPNHTHSLEAEGAPAEVNNPTKAMLGGHKGYVKPGTSPNIEMSNQSITSTGGGQPFSIQDPYLGMYVCIALVGIFPSRS